MGLFFIKVSLVINLMRTQMYFADVVHRLAFLRTMHDLDQRLIFINFICKATNCESVQQLLKPT